MGKEGVLARLYEQQNQKCYYCTRTLQMLWPAYYRQHRNSTSKEKILKRYTRFRTQPTFDHVILKSNGGQVSIDNGVCACRECNQTRGGIKFEDFVVLVTCLRELKNLQFIKREKVLVNRKIKKDEKRIRRIERAKIKFIGNMINKYKLLTSEQIVV